jgi:hypothetical protein
VGNCAFCGQPAGFLRSEHPECRKRDDERRAEQARLLADLERDATEVALHGEAALAAAVPQLTQRASAPDLAGANTRGAIVKAWGSAINRLLDGEGVTKESETALARYAAAFALTDAEKREGDALDRMVKALILHDAASGELASRVTIDGPVPFLLKKGEFLLWLFRNVRFLQVREFTRFEGRSAGVSVRVVKGVYFRTGAFRGAPVKHEQTVTMDTGLLGLTPQAIYFAGPKKSLRLPYSKLVSIEPYSDGVGLQKDGASAKAMTFTPLDGWFAYNLIKNLSAL